MKAYQKAFIQYAMERQILKFGDFTLKSGIQSPYFFNFGLLNDGESIQRLADFYAETYIDLGLQCDVLFGPAYKGIPIATATAAAIYQKTGASLGFSYNRKEMKSHGEGGLLVGANPENRRVIIIDDVISRGTAIRESLQLLQSLKGVKVEGFLVALDRMDIGQDGKTMSSALLSQETNLPIWAGVNFNHLMDYVESHEGVLDEEAMTMIRSHPRANA